MVCLIVRILRGREWGSAPWRVGYGQMRVLCGTGVGGAVPVLDDGGLGWRGSGEGRGCGAGAREVEASQTCGFGHHQCGAGHPSRLPLFRMVSSKTGAGSASGAVGGEWRHTNERW